MRFSYIGCRCGCHCSLVTERDGLIDHVAEQVPGPVRRNNRVEIGRRNGQRGLSWSCGRKMEMSRCARPATKGEFLKFSRTLQTRENFQTLATGMHSECRGDL